METTTFNLEQCLLIRGQSRLATGRLALNGQRHKEALCHH